MNSRAQTRLILALIVLALGGLAASPWQKARLEAAVDSAPAPTPSLASKPDETPTPPASAAERNPSNELMSRPETQAIRNTPPNKIKSLYTNGSFGRQRLTQTALELERSLVECLRRNLCDQKPDGIHPYFDESRTPAHRLLAHALEILRLASQEDPALVRDFGGGELLGQLDIANDNIQTTLIEIYLSRSIDDGAYGDLLTRAPVLVNEARAKMFLALRAPERTTPLRRPRYLEALTESLRRDDNATPPLVQKLAELDLSADELRQVATPLCRYRESPDTQQNWLLAKHFIDQAAHGAWSLDSLCSVR